MARLQDQALHFSPSINANGFSLEKDVVDGELVDDK